jgi:predicted Ser/Thr protein kinase
VGPETPEESSWAAPTSRDRDEPVLPLPGVSMTRRREPMASLSRTEGRSGGHTQIGRYVVLKEVGAGGELGSGGMGLVLAAYDADLERKVALKILREGVRDGSAGAVRMRREAQAMARLSHPNVAQVYEVADDGGVLFLAMEYIEGQTLREWLQATPRTWREVLRVFVEAGRGLAAAHAVGLMHRDFKPDNAMLATDGRVRVLDFGLSRLCQTDDAPATASTSGRVLEMHVTGVGTLLGTPAYMSPEQLEREEVDARSDQFSFCVAVWEALYGQRPFVGESVQEVMACMRRNEVAQPSAKTKVPAWVRRVLERGLAIEPSLRWPGMEPLLVALSRDPQRTRRRWLAAAAAAVALTGASYGVAAYRTAEAQVCSGAADELIGVWDAERRAAVEAALRTTEVAYAERAWLAVSGHLDAYAATWLQIHMSSCTSHQRGHMSTQLFDRRMACLRQRRNELAGTATVLAQTTRETVAQAVDTARGLPPLATLCEDDERLLAAVAPPEEPETAAAVEAARGQLARLEALERSGRYNDALAEMPMLLAQAEDLAYLPYQAEVHLLAGKLQMQRIAPAEARVHLDLALQLGIEAKLDALAAEALSLTIFSLANGERRPDEALSRAPLAWALVRRVGSPPLLAARLHNVVGAAHHERGDEEKSIAEQAQGLALLEAHGSDDPLRWATANNLAMSLDYVGQHERAGKLARAALVQLVQQYDVCHPHAAALQGLVAGIDAAIGEFARSFAGYARALDCFGEDYPAYSLVYLHELGGLHLVRGDVEATRRQLARADELMTRFPETRPRALELELLRADLAIHLGQLADARGLLERLRTQAPPTRETDMLYRVDARLGLIAHREHDDARALELLQAAAPLLEPEHLNSERGLYAFTLARALQGLGGAPDRVATLVEQATAAYETIGAHYAGRVAEILAWQAGEGAPL